MALDAIGGFVVAIAICVGVYRIALFLMRRVGQPDSQKGTSRGAKKGTTHG